MTSNEIIEWTLAGYPVPDLLLEGRLDFLTNKYKDISTRHDVLAQHKEPEKIVQHFAQNADPSTNKQYTDRILHWYSKGLVRQEDHERIHQALSDFHDNKRRLPLEQREIGKYGSLQDVQAAVRGVAPAAPKVPWASSGKDNRTVKEGSKLLIDTPELAVRKVNTHDAMQVLGSGTEWCVVPKGQGARMFDGYKSEGDLVHIHDKGTGERFLLHSNSGQLMDVKDNDVDPDILYKKHPSLANIPDFARHSAGNSSNEHVVHQLASNPDLHQIIAGNRNAHARTLGLIASPNMSTDTAIALSGNPNSTTHILDLAYRQTGQPGDEREDEHITGGLARHKNTHPDTLHSIAVNDNSHGWTAALVAGNTNAHTKTLHTIADMARKFVASSQYGVLGEYGEGSSASTQLKNLSNNKKADVALLHKIHGIAPYETVAGLVQHPNSDPPLMRKLYDYAKHKEMGGAISNIASHPNTPLDVVKTIIDSSSGSGYDWNSHISHALKNPNLDHDTFMHAAQKVLSYDSTMSLLTHPFNDSRSESALHDNFKKAIHSGDVHGGFVALAKHGKSPDILDELSKHPDWVIGRNAANNPNAPPEAKARWADVPLSKEEKQYGHD